MRVLVTGASGYIGRHLVPRLTQRGDQVLAWGGPRWQPSDSHESVETAAVDLADTTAPLPDVQPVDAVVWLAQGRGHREFPSRATDVAAVNLLGLTRTLDWSRRAGARVCLYASTANVYAPSLDVLSEDSPTGPSSFYAATKFTGEQLAQQYEAFFAVRTLRIFGVYGPGQQQMLLPQLIRRITSGQPVELQPASEGHTDEGLQWTPCHVRDVVAALSELIDEPYATEALNIAGPEQLSIAGAARAIGRQLGKQPEFVTAKRLRRFDLIGDSSRLVARMPEHGFITLDEALPEILGTPARLAVV